jgi:hypothetical protein
MNYFYELSRRSNKHPWYRIWHRSRFVRDLFLASWNLRYRLWLRFANRHKLWLTLDQEYIESLRGEPIWPR